MTKSNSKTCIIALTALAATLMGQQAKADFYVQSCDGYGMDTGWAEPACSDFTPGWGGQPVINQHGRGNYGPHMNGGDFYQDFGGRGMDCRGQGATPCGRYVGGPMNGQPFYGNGQPMGRGMNGRGCFAPEMGGHGRGRNNFGPGMGMGRGRNNFAPGMGGCGGFAPNMNGRGGRNSFGPSMGGRGHGRNNFGPGMGGRGGCPRNNGPRMNRGGCPRGGRGPGMNRGGRGGCPRGGRGHGRGF